MSAVTPQQPIPAAELYRAGQSTVGESDASMRSMGPTAHSRRHHRDEWREPPPRTSFVPLGVLSLALLVWVGFQTFQLAGERQRLTEAVAGQVTMMQNSQKLRANLDSLATETAKLAEQGNAGARLLVDELRKRGVTINAAGPAAAAPK